MLKPITGFVVVLVSLTACLSFYPIAAAGPDSIAAVCRKSKDRNLCVNSFQSKLNGRVAPPTELAIIALRLAASNSTDTSQFVKNMLDGGYDLDPAVDYSLNDCQQGYLDAVEQLDNSLAALLANAYADVSAWVNAAIADVQTCQNSLNGQPETQPGMARRNANALVLCENALIVIDMLANKSL